MFNQYISREALSIIAVFIFLILLIDDGFFLILKKYLVCLNLFK